MKNYKDSDGMIADAEFVMECSSYENHNHHKYTFNCYQLKEVK